MRRGIVILSIVAMCGLLGLAAIPPEKQQDGLASQPTVLTDEVFIYRGELFYRDQPFNGPVDLEFRLFAGESDEVQISPTIEAPEWEVVDGRFAVGLELGDPLFLEFGAWLEVTVDGTVLSPRQFVPPPGWTLVEGEILSKREQAREAELMTGFLHRDEAGSDDGALNRKNGNTAGNDTDAGSVARSGSSRAREGSGATTLSGGNTGELSGTSANDPTQPQPPDSELGEDGETMSASATWRLRGIDIVWTNHRVGIGARRPRAKLEIKGKFEGFTLYAVGGKSYFSGKVGIGTTDLTSRLTVNGLIESTSGGVKFPDGTTQTTAAPTYDAGNGILITTDNFIMLDPQDAPDGYVLKWDDAQQIWTPAPDNDTTYTAGQGLRLNGTRFRLDPQNAEIGEVLKWHMAGGWRPGTDNEGNGGGWGLNGNAGTNPPTDFLGTTDDQPLVLKVNGLRVVRLEPHTGSPNVIHGFEGNSVGSGFGGNSIGGGGDVDQPNIISSTTATGWATIGGGRDNSINDSDSTISGGRRNRVLANADWGTIGGGLENTVRDDSYATVSGGNLNTASDSAATVSGGKNNTASGEEATVAGGRGNVASGASSFVAGGEINTAAGDHSFAAGRDAEALHNGAFVWSDTSSGNEPASTGVNQWISRASGGYWLFSNASMSAGVTLPPGGSAWQSISDRNAKDNFEPVDTVEVLARLSAISMETWNYKSQDPSIRHIGPMAQDFYAAFGVGEDEKHITTIDADGVALAAIQGLYKIVKEKDAEIEDLRNRLDTLESLVAQLVANEE